MLASSVNGDTVSHVAQHHFGRRHEVAPKKNQKLCQKFLFINSISFFHFLLTSLSHRQVKKTGNRRSSVKEKKEKPRGPCVWLCLVSWHHVPCSNQALTRPEMVQVERSSFVGRSGHWFSNFNVPKNHPGIPLNCQFWFQGGVSDPTFLLLGET